jgi:hypothetical protein
VLPEGNAGFVVDCSFEQDGADAAEGEICFAFGQEGGGYADAAEFFGYVERDDVGERRIFFGEDKSGDVGVLHGDQAVRGSEREEVTQSGLGVRDAGREAGLVEAIESGKVLRIVGAEDRGHKQDSTPGKDFAEGTGGASRRSDGFRRVRRDPPPPVFFVNAYSKGVSRRVCVNAYSKGLRGAISGGIETGFVSAEDRGSYKARLGGRFHSLL